MVAYQPIATDIWLWSHSPDADSSAGLHSPDDDSRHYGYIRQMAEADNRHYGYFTSNIFLKK